MKFPNAENLVSKFCRVDPIILATPLGADTYTELPSGFASWPACRVTRVGGAVFGGARPHADNPLIQFDIWGGPKSVAYDIAATIVDRLAARSPWQGPDGVLAVERIGGLRYLPDVEFDPAKPRYTFDVLFVVRP